jgi:hypothetical protein
MLDFTINLIPLTSDNGTPGVAITEGTATWDPGQREQSALVLAAEWLHADATTAPPLAPFYRPQDFKSPSGGDVTMFFQNDGLLRLVVAAVPVYDSEQALLAPDNTAYVTPSGLARVRQSAMPTDLRLNPLDLLGNGPGPAPEVLGFVAVYYLNDKGLKDSLAHLNLRYLRLAYQQQGALVALYERAALYQSGVEELYRQGRYLDAAATLRAAQYLLVTNGQTPDDFGPVLGGTFPYTAS